MHVTVTQLNSSYWISFIRKNIFLTLQWQKIVIVTTHEFPV